MARGGRGLRRPRPPLPPPPPRPAARRPRAPIPNPKSLAPPFGLTKLNYLNWSHQPNQPKWSEIKLKHSKRQVKEGEASMPWMARIGAVCAPGGCGGHAKGQPPQGPGGDVPADPGTVAVAVSRRVRSGGARVFGPRLGVCGGRQGHRVGVCGVVKKGRGPAAHRRGLCPRQLRRAFGSHLSPNSHIPPPNPTLPLRSSTLASPTTLI